MLTIVNTLLIMAGRLLELKLATPQHRGRGVFAVKGLAAVDSRYYLYLPQRQP
jgi:hypothetical protein